MKWKLLDVMEVTGCNAKEGFEKFSNLSEHLLRPLPKFSDGATERCCLKCASTLKSCKVKAASAHLWQVLAASAHSEESSSEKVTVTAVLECWQDWAALSGLQGISPAEFSSLISRFAAAWKVFCSGSNAQDGMGTTSLPFSYVTLKSIQV